MTLSTLAQIAKGRIDPELLKLVDNEIAYVESELSGQMSSPIQLIETIGRHTLDAGGKRLRPAFVTLSARSTGNAFDVDRTRRLGACMEMIHMATLIHDDVIDRSDTRRGHPTAAALYGNTAAILSGDVLLSRAMTLLAEDGDLPIIRRVSAAVVDMAQGEVRELEIRGDFDLCEEKHMEVLRLKTASFIQCCCVVGAIVAGAEETVCEALATYGHHVGIAFQIVDDLLDYRGDQVLTGKPTAIDFRDAQTTLPLIYLRPHLSEAEYAIIKRKFGNGVTDDELRMIEDWMETRGAFSKAQLEAERHIDTAVASLEVLPAGPPRDLLAAVARYVVIRES